MKNEQRYNLHRLAEELVTPQRFGKPALEGALQADEVRIDEQPTIEFDSAEVARLCEIERQRDLIDRELTADVEAEKARILNEQPYWGD